MNAAWNPEELPTNNKYDLFHLLGDATTLTELTIRRAHLLGRHVKDLTLQKMNLVIFNCLDTTLFNLHAFETTFDGGDFACCRFEGGFFQHVKFNDCNFRQAEFANCVFDNCEFSTKEGITFERCIFLEKKEEVVTATTATQVSAPPLETPVKPEGGRFSSLEK